MEDGDPVNVRTDHEFLQTLNRLVEQAMAIADRSADARDVVNPLRRIVDLVEKSPEHRDVAAEVFLGLLDERPGELVLGVPGAIEVLEFSMHRLRWPDIADALIELHTSHPDLRVRESAERVLEAFEDPWPTGEIYGLAPEGP